MRKVFSYNFFPENNGGEALLFVQEYDDRDVICQRLTLQSYNNSTSIIMGTNPLTPKKLRELADALEKINS